MLHWLLEHCQRTGFNEGFSYRVIDCDLIIEPLMEMIGGVWREQNEAFCGLTDAHTWHQSKLAPGICNLPSGAPVPNAQTPHGYVCEDVRTTDFLLFFLLFFFSIDEHMCGSFYRVSGVHLSLIWSLSHLSLSCTHYLISFILCPFIICSFLVLYLPLGLFMFLF